MVQDTKDFLVLRKLEICSDRKHFVYLAQAIAQHWIIRADMGRASASSGASAWCAKQQRQTHTTPCSPKCPQQPWSGQAEARSRELNPGLLCGHEEQAPSHQSHNKNHDNKESRGLHSLVMPGGCGSYTETSKVIQTSTEQKHWLAEFRAQRGKVNCAHQTDELALPAMKSSG